MIIARGTSRTALAFRFCRHFHFQQTLLQQQRNPNSAPTVPLKSLRNLPGRFRDKESPHHEPQPLSPADSLDDQRSLLPSTRCVLVGVRLPHMTDAEVESSLEELSQLVSTLGLVPAYKITQKRTSLRGHVLGSGKINEIARLTGGPGVLSDEGQAEPSFGEQIDGVAAGEEAGAVVIDVALSATQIRVLEDALGVEVHDRPSIIMSIFQRHARTKEAKLQVEIARLTYLAPRLREINSSEDRVRGGVGGRGVGETSIELESRKVRDKIADLRRELATVQKVSEKQRRLREGSVVALVGYTNAGKSSLFRALTGADVLVADQLFATLDTTVRTIPRTAPRLLVSDTVGFINNLPHELIASFRSTLAEARNAGLLLLVVDASDREWRMQLGVVRQVLKEMKVTRPTLLVMNKIDRLGTEERQGLAEEAPDAVLVSALDTTHISQLRERIVEFFEQDAVEWECFISYPDQQALQSIYDSCRVLSATHDDKGTTLRLKVHSDILEQLRSDDRVKSLSD